MKKTVACILLPLLSLGLISWDKAAGAQDTRPPSETSPSPAYTVFAKDLAEPRDPVLDAAGNLYVAETMTGRILKFSGAF